MLSSTSKYALRVLVALADRGSQDYVLRSVLADDTEIPSDYLGKVLLTLGCAGVVEGQRGRGGGYRLTRDPADIYLIEAVEAFEGVRTHPSCVLGVHEECSDARPCSAHEIFRTVRAHYITFLTGTSIADIARSEAPCLPGRL